MNFMDVLLTRRTTRSYLPQQISKSELDTLLLAAHMAPIAGAEYTNTHLTVLQNEAILSEVRSVCGRVNAETGGTRDSFYGAPTIIFLSANGISNDKIEYSNIGCAIENMLLAATSLGLGSTYIWGCLRNLRKHPEVIARLQVPEGYEILSAVACGYPTTPLSLREPKEYLGVNYVE